MLGPNRISNSTFEGGAYVREIDFPMSGLVRLSVPHDSEPIADVIFMDRPWPLQRIEANSHEDLVSSINDKDVLTAIGVSAIHLQLNNSVIRKL